ncbi:hypothetical protein NDU88_007922 [Pleurodeles waltl]|uniref:Uncharacterized protein n=1 Tax=Pleurodeles waltl TaxID=8319 RepID=A0AAV7PNY3_PLEWA|nr:hypothetical protein NDU88_007922 [Pleurodeles waltl]
MHPVQPPISAQGQPTVSHDATAQALLSVAQLLSKLDIPFTPVPPTAHWAPSTVNHAIADLKQQINDIVVLCFNGVTGPGNKGSRGIPSLGVKEPPKLDSEPGAGEPRQLQRVFILCVSVCIVDGYGCFAWVLAALQP